ncbi:BON domain-containing protein [Haloferula chungangensis]|uniref:BON domain-containing protein n=1 Tax=Haloferula chungangensis TaxID=1048331 RepID=A0ABW2L786_9BACT
MKTNRISLLTAALLGISPMLVLGTPEPGPSTDQGYAEFLKVAYDSSPRLEGAVIDIQVEDHIAILSGQVETIDQAEFAASLAITTNGVYGAVNQLKISPEQSEPELVRVTREALDKSKAIDPSRIQVSQSGNTIILKGEVSTYDERELAREMVSRIKGVHRIENQLSIEFADVRPEEAIQEQLLIQFHDDPLFDMLPVNIKVSDGTATLSGQVGSLDEKNRLERTSLVTGVMSVDSSKLQINSDLRMEGMGDKPYMPSDSLKVANLVLEADPRVDASSLQLEMQNGTILLSGTALSHKARHAAEDDVRGVPGVLGVVNQIEVSSSLSKR